ncbi:cytochrome c oxidase accessory protein CcoG [Candidatus Zixiibacteriota bacterium]
MNPPVDQSFRDKIATADEHGRRIWVYPTKPKGKLHSSRTFVSYFLIAFLLGAPFIKIGGEPLLLFDIINRKFIIFSYIFWPQDFHLFVLGTITLTVFIVLFTAVYGRLFCGWICPQTIFMEMVFRKIEYLIEGNAGAQRRLNNSHLSFNKFVKKTTKHSIFYSISFLIGNIFLAYFIGVDQLQKIVIDPPSQHVTGLIAMIIFSFLFYGVFAWFREQVCTLVCPYGRLQSVLLDDNTIVIAYDHIRGEPRSEVSRNEDFSNRGHCIDCELCVKVCPTGIDIRNGTQLECINCTACIDACNSTMKKMNLPPGLIRYASGNNIERKEKFKFTARIFGYTTALVFLLGLLTILMLNRTEIETTILRTPGTLYEETVEGTIKNLYTIKIVNKTNLEKEVSLKITSHDGEVTIIGGNLTLNKNDLAETVFFVEIDKAIIYTTNTLITIAVYSNEEKLEEITTNFLGPN